MIERLDMSLKVIHISTLMSSQSLTWKMTTQVKLDITEKLIGRFEFCKKCLIVRNFQGGNQAIYKN